MYNEDEQQYKLFTDLSKLIIALKQETLNPEILAFETEAYESLHQAIKEQDERIKSLIEVQPEQSDMTVQQKNFKQLIYSTETQKISYILKEYLRLRLQKIEKYAFYLIKNQTQVEKKLSPHEFEYMKAYAELKYKYFQENVLKRMVKAYRGLGGIEVYFSKINQLKLQVDSNQSKVEIAGPDMLSFCFAQITNNPDLSLRYNYDIKAKNIEGQQVIPSGSIVYTEYKNVKNLISESNAFLI